MVYLDFQGSRLGWCFGALGYVKDPANFYEVHLVTIGGISFGTLFAGKPTVLVFGQRGTCSGILMIFEG